MRLAQDTHRLHTYTLFATQDIAKGEMVGVASGVIMESYKHAELIGSPDDRRTSGLTTSQQRPCR